MARAGRKASATAAPARATARPVSSRDGKPVDERGPGGGGKTLAGRATELVGVGEVTRVLAACQQSVHATTSCRHRCQTDNQRDAEFAPRERAAALNLSP